MILLHLFYEFFITGLFMFGGGLASIPFLEQMSIRTGWFTIEQLMDMLAISESTPGPISVNVATYAGYMTAGVPGGIIATLGLIAPSVIVASIAARLLDRFKGNPLVDSAFYGLRPASMGLIAAACLTVFRLSLLNIALWEQTGSILDLFDIKAVALAGVLLVLILIIKKAHPIIFLAGSAVVGILIF
jgi:chromate transporter